MNRNTKVALAAALIAAFTTQALAAQDEWIVDSGRYLNGQIPSYTAQEPGVGAPRLIARHAVEGRNAAIIGTFGTVNSAPSGRDAMVQAAGN